jgi:hypothetical protein
MKESAAAALANTVYRVRRRLLSHMQLSASRPFGVYGSKFHSRGCVIDIQHGKQDDEIEKFGHECMHWWQYSGTPYGLFLARSVDLQTSNIIGLCHWLSIGLECKRQETLGIPLLPWLLKTQPFHNPSISFNSVRSWLACEDSIGALEGEEPLLYADELAEAILGTNALFQHQDATYGTLDFPKGNGVSSVEVFDPVVPRVEGKPFGALQVMECAARINEICLKYKDYDVNEALLVGIYGVAYRLVRCAFPTAPSKTVVLTLLALADVSLWSEIDPCTRSTNSNHIKWKHIHPGWRFLRGVEELSKLGLLTDKDEYSSFVDEISALAGWVPLSHLMRRSISMHIPKDNPIVSNFRRWCELRQQVPWAFAFPIYVAESVGALQPPIFRTNNRFVFLGSSEEALALIRAHDINTLARQLAVGAEFSAEDLLYTSLDFTDGGYTLDQFIQDTFYVKKESVISFYG